MCIICFLEDEMQKKMRNIAQSNNDRFESTLQSYKKDFIFRFNNITKVNECNKHKDLTENVKEWADSLYDAIKQNIDIEAYFEQIILAYLKWITNDSTTAVTIMKACLQKTDYTHQKVSRLKKQLFRTRKSNSLLSREELYHIPFNKRYLVGNQRYSLSGVPSLYFGLSIPDLISEMRGNYQDLDNYVFSSFLLKKDENLKIFDFTNRFSALFSIIDELASVGGKIIFNDPTLRPNKQDCLNSFYLFILNSCCSFNRRDKSEGNVFSEEYILPQLVTQIISKEEFDGLAFTSTRIDDKEIYSKQTFYQNGYKLNYVLFTKYDSNDLYDKQLISKFYISEPKSIKDFQEITLEDFEIIKKDFVNLQNTKGLFNSINDMAEYTGISFDTDFSQVYIKDKDGKESKYIETKMGKFHLYLLYSSLIELRDTIA